MPRIAFDVEWLSEEPRVESKLTCMLVFQVNCPGCFQHALPRLIDLRKEFEATEVTTIAVATAFEDHDLNTKANTLALMTNGTIVGETAKFYGRSRCDLDLKDLHVAFDVIRRVSDIDDYDDLVEAQATKMIAAIRQRSHLPDEARGQIVASLRQKPTFASTFDGNGLLGTPSWLVFDSRSKELRFSTFGDVADVDGIIRDLLAAAT
mmetsp:Transcript_8949/g.22656  ORF Transcript_8949/g.22656 Transcript_8949/m.22656 type:complete len:207 (-) Transcript_8949:38-658(-)